MFKLDSTQSHDLSYDTVTLVSALNLSLSYLFSFVTYLSIHTYSYLFHGFHNLIISYECKEDASERKFLKHMKKILDAKHVLRYPVPGHGPGARGDGLAIWSPQKGSGPVPWDLGYQSPYDIV
jgi:hypothetical protein